MGQKLDERETSAVLAGLRLLQQLSKGGIRTGSAELDASIDDIHTNGGEIEGLSESEIDDLCERLNAWEDVA